MLDTTESVTSTPSTPSAEGGTETGQALITPPSETPSTPSGDTRTPPLQEPASLFKDILGESPAEQTEASDEAGEKAETPSEPVEIDYSFTSDLELQHVEFDPESPLLQSFKEIAKDAGLKQEDVEKLVSGYLQSLDVEVGKTVGAFSASAEALAQNTIDTLKSEWGEAYEQKTQRISQLLKSTFPEEALAVLRSSPDLGSSVALIKGFAEIADRFGESAFVEGSFSTVTDAHTYKTSQAFMEQHKDILMNPSHSDYAEFQRRYLELIKTTQKLGA